jgi:hypothetical protein
LVGVLVFAVGVWFFRDAEYVCIRSGDDASGKVVRNVVFFAVAAALMTLGAMAKLLPDAVPGAIENALQELTKR